VDVTGEVGHVGRDQNRHGELVGGQVHAALLGFLTWRTMRLSNLMDGLRGVNAPGQEIRR
jgi:hypothetical protein